MPPSTSASCMSARPGGSDHVDTPKPNPRTTTMSPPSAGSWQHCEQKGKLEGSAAHECHKCLQQGLGARRTDPSANGLLGHRAVPWMSAMALSAPVGG